MPALVQPYLLSLLNLVSKGIIFKMGLTIIVSSLLTLMVSHKALSATQATQAEQRYQVDLILFENLALKGWTEEFWPMAVDTAIIDGAIDFSQAEGLPLKVIQAQNPMLKSEASRVAKNYRLLLHKSWIQSALPKNQSPKLFLENETATSAYYGTIKMYQSRFNHIELDFNFERMIPNKVRAEFAQMQNLPLETLPTYWPFHLDAKRKVKSGELHYIDHPLFGILIQIQKLDDSQ